MKRTLATRSTNSSAAIDNLGALAPRIGRGIARCTAALLLLPGLAATDACGQTSTAARQQAIDRWSEPRTIDSSRLARQGFRVLSSRHATLVTDLPESDAVDELPAVVDAAVPLLAERFDIDAARVRTWHVLAMVIADRQKFAAARLMPRGHENFRDGLAIGHEIWVADQPSDYYRRHLLLHELVHSFMATQLGSCGPGWYMEAMAELLGTHRWQAQGRKLELGVMPSAREQVPMWGRTSLVRDAVTDQRLLPITAVMQIDNRQPLDVESYAWVWALGHLLDHHPRYRQRFRSLERHTLDPEFNERFRRLFSDDWSRLETEWRWFAGSVDYGYNVPQAVIRFPDPTDPQRTVRATARVNVSAEETWQSTGLVLQAGERYELGASGRFVVGREEDGTPWICEPGGITLEYHNGEPLGTLLAAVDPLHAAAESEGPPPASSAFLRPHAVGRGAQLTPQRTGVLYLRVNESPARLDDNRGDVAVRVRKLP